MGEHEHDDDDYEMYDGAYYEYWDAREAEYLADLSTMSSPQPVEIVRKSDEKHT